MKADERKKLERNELATRLTDYWSGVNSNSTRANWLWLGVLGGLLALLGWVFYSRLAAGWDAARWGELTLSGDVAGLNRLIQDNPTSVQAAIASLQIARLQFRESLGDLAALNPEKRISAADKLDLLRKDFDALAKNAQLPPALIQEAMMQRARAEETLAAVPKSDNPAEFRGKIDTAIAYYEELKTRYPASVNGEQAAARADQLKKRRGELDVLNAALAQDIGKPPAAPALPAGVTPALPESPAPKP
jgi:hypothetical protein